MAKLLVRSAGAETPVGILLERLNDGRGDGYRVAIDERRTEVEIESTGEGRGWLHLRGRIVRYYTARRGDEIHVWIDGRVHVLQIVDRTARRTAGPAVAGATGALTAPMPGTILKINVSVGDAFEAHAPLIVMESMKMEMTLSAPQAGRVKQMLCRVGELVETGKVLAKLEALDDAAA